MRNGKTTKFLVSFLLVPNINRLEIFVQVQNGNWWNARYRSKSYARLMEPFVAHNLSTSIISNPR